MQRSRQTLLLNPDVQARIGELREHIGREMAAEVILMGQPLPVDGGELVNLQARLAVVERERENTLVVALTKLLKGAENGTR